MQLLEDLKWRYATKKFNSEKKISAEDLEKLKQSVQLSASSYGLQPYKVLLIEDMELRKKLQPISWNQSQIVDASHLFVFVNRSEIERDDVTQIMEKKAIATGKSVEEFEAYTKFILSKMDEKNPDEIKNWTARQCYIALGNLLSACAELKIDACPMEGFEPKAYNEMLGLKGYETAVLVTVGYRSEEDASAHAPKVRKSEEELFETI